jgi:hypothetical protein
LIYVLTDVVPVIVTRIGWSYCSRFICLLGSGRTFVGLHGSFALLETGFVNDLSAHGINWAVLLGIIITILYHVVELASFRHLSLLSANTALQIANVFWLLGGRCLLGGAVWRHIS